MMKNLPELGSGFGIITCSVPGMSLQIVTGRMYVVWYVLGFSAVPVLTPN